MGDFIMFFKDVFMMKEPSRKVGLCTFSTKPKIKKPKFTLTKDISNLIRKA